MDEFSIRSIVDRLVRMLLQQDEPKTEPAPRFDPDWDTPPVPRRREKSKHPVGSQMVEELASTA